MLGCRSCWSTMGDYIHGEMIAYWLLKSKYLVRENIFLYWRFGGPANFCARSAPYDGLHGAIWARNDALGDVKTGAPRANRAISSPICGTKPFGLGRWLFRAVSRARCDPICRAWLLLHRSIDRSPAASHLAK